MGKRMNVRSARTDFALAVPADWCSLTRLDSLGVQAALTAWRGAVDELAEFQGAVRAMLGAEAERVGDAAGIGLIACAFLDCERLVTGTAGVFVVPNPFMGADGMPVVDPPRMVELARTELTPNGPGPVGSQPSGTPASGTPAAEPVSAVVLRGDGGGTPAMRVRMLATVPAYGGAGDVGVDRVQHFVPIPPDGRDLLLLDFLTPFLNFSDEMINLWDKVVETFRWVPDR